MSGDAARGYTLVEVLVAMLIFAVVMTLISISFGNIVRNAGQLGKRVETDIGGLIGLEVMRSDLELAGFGLPWSGTEGLNYEEAPESLQLVTSCGDGCPKAKAHLYNDKPYLQEPAAIRVGSKVGFNGSDYLVLKGSALGANTFCRSWCYLNYSSITKPSRVEPELKSGSKVRAVVLRTGFTATGGRTKELVINSKDESHSDFTFFFNKSVSTGFAPPSRSESYLVYGVAKPADDVLLSFPFNRSDYYINRKSDIASSCNKGTGTLYKAVINQQKDFTKFTDSTDPTKYPLLDCAADMQVVFYMDTDHDGDIDYHPGPEDGVFTGDVLREELKEIRVYILAQQGKKDPAYQYPVQDPERAIVVGDPEVVQYGLGRVWSESAMSATFGADWRNYHWKIYTIVVQPKNL